MTPREQLVEALSLKQEGICPLCGESLRDPLEIDHIKPLSLGGSNESNNLWLLHKECHRKRHQVFHPWHTAKTVPHARGRLQVAVSMDLAEWVHTRATRRGMTTSGLVRWLLSWYRSECENDREPLTIGDSPEEEEMMELLAGGDLS